uniref:G-protein coupled receptors family 1 profile domain-containing protein n=1 Tax=Plectus sambesii TaxID=2011161 RepID=A0A914XR09_9BILA
MILYTNIALFLLGIISVLGNGFILLVIGRYKKLRADLCNLLISILAIADFGSGLGCLDRGLGELIFVIFDYYEYTKGECLLLGFMSLFSVHMSQLITAVIAFDRLDAVQNPFGYATKSKAKRATTILVLIVAYSLFGMGIAFIGVDLSEHPETCATGSCVLDLYAAYWASFATIVAIFVFYGYLRTTLVLRRKLITVNSSMERRELKRQKAVFKTISLVLLVYGLSWCVPNFLLIIVTVMGNQTGIGLVSSLIAIGTGIHSSCNVFIYALKHKEIGAHMRQFIGKSGPGGVSPAQQPQSQLFRRSTDDNSQRKL